MSNLYLIFTLVDKINNLFIFLFILFIALTIIYAITWGVKLDNANLDNADAEKFTKLKETYLPPVRRLIITSIVAIIIFILLPSGKTVLTWSVLNETDKYNNENPDSKLSPRSALTIIDKTIQRVDRILGEKFIKRYMMEKE